MYVNMIIKVNTRNEYVVDEVIALCPTKIIATLKPGMKNDYLVIE